MEYIKKEFAAYNIHIIKTDIFKTITIDVNFLRHVKKEEITIRNFLSEILLQSNKNFTTKRSLAIQANNLYNPIVMSSNGRIGSFSNLSFSTQFLNEKYTEEGMNEKSINFFLDLLFNPNVENDNFDLKSFNIVKEFIKNEIKSIKDNTTKYGLIRLLENMGKDEPFSYGGYGYLEDLDNITTDNLYEYYKDILRSDKVEIFVVGDVEEEQIIEYLSQNFKVNTVKKDMGSPIIEHEKLRGRINKIDEKENIIQAKFNIGCKLKNLSEYERRYVLPFYNEILGGSSSSKLFTNVREKNSLAYYITSMVKQYDNILMIYSGINRDDSEKVLSLVKKDMTNMKKGNIEDNEIEVARKNILTSLDTITDSPSRIISAYFSKELSNGDDIETRKEKFKKITKDDIVDLAKKIKIDTVYLMHGEDN